MTQKRSAERQALADAIGRKQAATRALNDLDAPLRRRQAALDALPQAEADHLKALQEADLGALEAHRLETARAKVRELRDIVAQPDHGPDLERARQAVEAADDQIAACKAQILFAEGRRALAARLAAEVEEKASTALFVAITKSLHYLGHHHAANGLEDAAYRAERLAPDPAEIVRAVDAFVRRLEGDADATISNIEARHAA